MAVFSAKGGWFAIWVGGRLARGARFLPQKSLSLAIGTVQAEIPAAKTFQDAPTTPTF